MLRIGPLNISWSSEKRDSLIWQQEVAKFVSCLTGGYSEQNMLKLFETIPEIFAPIDTIAGAVCSAKWELRKISDGSVVENNKDWNRIYEKPNWKQDWHKFLYTAIVYKYVTGNRYFYAYVPSTLTVKLANIENLWLLPPQYTTIKIKTDRPNYLQVTSPNDLIQYYDFSSGRDRLQIKPEFVFHDIFLENYREGQEDLMRGCSPLVACEYPMSNLMAVYQARNVIYVKRGALGFMVSEKSDASGRQALTPNEKKQLREDYNDSYGVTRGKSPIAITNLPVNFVKTAMSISELEPFTETDASSDAIYGALRVPRELKPRSEGATYENQQKAERRLYTQVAIPEALQIASILNNMLKLTDMGLYICPSFEHIEALQQDKKEKSDVDWRNNETLRVRFQHGIITLNQWIAESGYEAVTGNKLYDKRIYDMDESELALVKSIIGIKSDLNTNNNGTQQSGSGN